MPYQSITVERDGSITVLTLNRPEAMNALHPQASFECHEAIDSFAVDPDQWVLVVTGAGERAFCAGLDLKYQASGGSLEMPDSGFGGLTTRRGLNKPVIAAIDGLALGGGFEMALACDLIVASERASFGLPETRVGLAPLAGGLFRLPRAIGSQRAMAMIFTGERVSADEGRRLGIVNKLVPAGGALAAARVLAGQIAQCGPLAIQAAKEAMVKGADLPVLEAIAAQWSWPAIQKMRSSEDYKEGPRAFAEKRAPRWTGR